MDKDAREFDCKKGSIDPFNFESRRPREARGPRSGALHEGRIRLKGTKAVQIEFSMSYHHLKGTSPARVLVRGI